MKISWLDKPDSRASPACPTMRSSCVASRTCCLMHRAWMPPGERRAVEVDVERHDLAAGDGKDFGHLALEPGVATRGPQLVTGQGGGLTGLTWLVNSMSLPGTLPGPASAAGGRSNPGSSLWSSCRLR